MDLLVLVLVPVVAVRYSHSKNRLPDQPVHFHFELPLTELAQQNCL
jgi:hypothetical protein